MQRIRKSLITLALFSLPIACAASHAEDVALQELISSARVLDHRSVIVDTGHPEDAGMCRGFDLSESQILEFFKKAALTSPGTPQRPTLWAPCQVEGHFLYQGKKFWFGISADSSAEIEIAPGDYAGFTCPMACRSLFYYGYGTSGDDG